VGLVVREEMDICRVFNMVQRIFNKYDAWENDLRSIVRRGGNLQEMIDRSFLIMENPMTVIGRDYYYLACSKEIFEYPELANMRPDKKNYVPRELIEKNVEASMTNQKRMEPVYTRNSQNGEGFFMNLFVRKIYAGTFRVAFALRKKRDGDLQLAQFLGKALEEALLKYALIDVPHHNQLGDLLLPVLQGMPVESLKMRELGIDVLGGVWLCMKIMVNGKVRSMVSMEYIFAQIEELLPGCAAFEFESALVVFINMNALAMTKEQILKKTEDFFAGMHLLVGVSNDCENLMMARYYYRQASVALEMGSRERPEEIYYCFSDYALIYLLSSCTGEFPLEFFLPKGFPRLLLHDENSQADYVKTLRTYLNNNMNISQTAKELYVHRSTLLERLKKIDSILGCNMDNPDERLMLSVLLRILEERDRARAKRVKKKKGRSKKGKDLEDIYVDVNKME